MTTETALDEMKDQSASLIIELRSRGSRMRSYLTSGRETILETAADCIELLLFTIAQYERSHHDQRGGGDDS